MKLAKVTAGAISAGLALAALGGCSSSDAASKQIGSKQACDLISPQEIATLSSTQAPASHSKKSSPECSYRFDNDLSIEIASGSVKYAPGGAKIAVKGYQATEIKMSGEQTCALDVSLSDDDPQQHFSIRTDLGQAASGSSGNTACGLNEKIATKIIDSLPDR